MINAIFIKHVDEKKKYAYLISKYIYLLLFLFLYGLSVVYCTRGDIIYACASTYVCSMCYLPRRGDNWAINLYPNNIKRYWGGRLTIRRSSTGLRICIFYIIIIYKNILLLLNSQTVFVIFFF